MWNVARFSAKTGPNVSTTRTSSPALYARRGRYSRTVEVKFSSGKQIVKIGRDALDAEEPRWD
jgi:hypothetical protein